MVEIVSKDGSLPAPSIHEKKALEWAGLNQSMRLACQLKPVANLSVALLMNRETDFDVVGKAQETVILFVDLRNFTKLSETTLPYDVVYILIK
jgi:adenylate cyclase